MITKEFQSQPGILKLREQAGPEHERTHSNRPDPQSPPRAPAQKLRGKRFPTGKQRTTKSWTREAVLDGVSGVRTEAEGCAGDSLSPSVPAVLPPGATWATALSPPPFCSGPQTARPALLGVGWGLPGPRPSTPSHWLSSSG